MIDKEIEAFMAPVPSKTLPNMGIGIFMFLSCMAIYSEAGDYVRPHPRPIISTPSTTETDMDPEQVHISLVGSDSMRVTWMTAEDVPSLVEYGKSPGNYTSSAFGEISSTYWYLFYKSGYIHNVVIGPLEANTTYYYRCGGHGPDFKLKTPPSELPIVFSVAGDLGQTEWTKSTLQHINESYHDVFLLPGDLSYADNSQSLWDSFGRLVEPLASSRPWMVTEGNHEVETIILLMEHAFKSYNARWQMPYKESGSTSNLYYSFEVAGVHVIMLGSYANYGKDSDQYKWLQGDLGKVDRVKTPWIFVLLHAPWYNTNAAHEGEGEKMRVAMEPLLYAAKVDLVFAGHVHAYERFTHVYNNTADPCGPIYITIGDGGNREGLALDFKEPQSELSVFREASFGHGELTVYNATHTHWIWHRNEDDELVVSDKVWLTSLSNSANSCQKLQESSISYDDEL